MKNVFPIHELNRNSSKTDWRVTNNKYNFLKNTILKSCKCIIILKAFMSISTDDFRNILFKKTRKLLIH